MPTTVYEREKPSPLMEKAMRIYILREKEKRKKAAAEAEKDFERRVQEEEEKRKKKQEEESTIEDTNKELVQYQLKLESLRDSKHQYFHKFKKLLNDENLKKFQKQQRELGNEIPPNAMMTSAAIRYQHHPSNMNVQGNSSVMSPSRNPMHFHMSPSNQTRKISNHQGSDEAIRMRMHQSSPQVLPQMSSFLPGSSSRHSNSPATGRLSMSMRADIDQSASQDLLPPQAKMARLQK